MDCEMTNSPTISIRRSSLSVRTRSVDSAVCSGLASFCWMRRPLATSAGGGRLSFD